MKRITTTIHSRYLRIALLAFLTLGVHPLSVLAQPRPCVEDAKKLCPSVTPGAGGMRKCLEQNRDKLSDECRKLMSEIRGGFPARFRGCETDLEKFCKGVAPGGGRLLRCLREHEKDLSEDCKQRVAGARPGGAAAGAAGQEEKKVAATPAVGGTPAAK